MIKTILKPTSAITEPNRSTCTHVLDSLAPVSSTINLKMSPSSSGKHTKLEEPEFNCTLQLEAI